MNQRIIWDALLDVRINLQNLIEMSNRFPNPSSHKLFEKAIQPEGKTVPVFDEVTHAVQDLLKELGHLQHQLLVNDSVVKVDMESARAVDFDDWDSVAQIQKKIEESCGPILDKWHTKALLPSVTSNRHHTLKLKSINQSIMGQVESTLSGRNLETLIQRSRIVPEDAKKVFGEPKERVTEEISTDKSKHHDPDTYNDEDFYSALIRDRIQSGLQGIVETNDPITMSQQYLRLRQLRRRRHKKYRVDRKSSKGRKLRYHVHDKLTMFMAPAVYQYPKRDTLMTQKLFQSMFGSRISDQKKMDVKNLQKRIQKS